MSGKDFIEVRVDVKDDEIVNKLDILRIERGVSSNSFIMQAIVDKLKNDGYLQNGVSKHKQKERELSGREQLRKSLQKISMRKF